MSDDTLFWVFAVLFGGFVALFMLMFLFSIVSDVIEKIREMKAEHNNKGTPWWKLIASSLMGILCVVGFLLLHVYFFVFLITGLLVWSLVSPSSRNRFDQLQQILATADINAVASGLAEISGVGQPYDEPLISPMGEKPCAAYIYTVDRIDRSTDSDGDTTKSYVQIKRDVGGERFYLEDKTGRIEVQAEKLEWLNFFPTNETESHRYRHREYVLDDTTEVLMIGEAWYEKGRSLFRFSKSKNILAMAPVSSVNFHNKWRPLKHRTLFMLAAMGLFIAFMLVAPIEIQGSKLVLDLTELQSLLGVSWF